jgi:hypothetical protein
VVLTVVAVVVKPQLLGAVNQRVTGKWAGFRRLVRALLRAQVKLNPTKVVAAAAVEAKRKVDEARKDPRRTFEIKHIGI